MNTLTTITLAALVSSATAQTCNFESPVSYSIPGGSDGPYFVASGDIDNDGDIDLITDYNGPGNDPTQILWNDGDGTFSLGPVLTAGWGFGQVALGDMDDDGDLDVLRVSYFSNGVYFYRNEGSSFSSGTYYSGGGGSRAVVWTDIDGDKDLDFVVTDKFGGQIRPYRNINGLGFTSVGLFPVGADPFGIDAGDIDGDGDNDIVVTNEDSATITVALNDGTGQFPMTQSYDVGERPVDVSLTDLNGDGWLDAVVANWDNLVGIGDTVSVLMSDMEVGFNNQVVYQVAARPTSVKAADMNGDGFIDIVASCGVDDEIAVLPGNGDGTFQTAETFAAGNSPEFLALGDFDGDGATDAAVVLGSPNAVSVLINACDTPVDPPVVDTLWHVGWDNFFNEDLPSHVAVDGQGNIVTAGSTYFTANEDDFYVVKFDADGNQLWDYTYNGTGDHYDKIYNLAIDSTDAVIVSGESWNNNFGVEWATIKINADGTTAWTKRYLAANTFSQQRPGGLAIGPNDEVAVCGYYINASFEFLFTVVVYDENGTMLWDEHLPTAGTTYTGQARAIAFDTQGNVIVTGSIEDDDEFGEELMTAKFAPDGTLLWSERLDATDSDFFNETIGRSLHVDGDDNIYVAATTYSGSATNDDFVVAKYAPGGGLEWSRTYSGLGATTAFKLTPLPDGTIVVSGSGGSGVVMHAFDGAGTTLWGSSVPASINSSNSTGHITLGSDGFLYLLGQAGSDLAVFQVDAGGTLLSTTDLDSGSATDNRAAITAGPNGTLYALGSYQPEIVNRRDFSLFKLSTVDTTCPADFVADGVLDFFDVQAFLSAFATEDPSADFVADGTFDFFDVLEFLQAFASGC